MAKIPIILEPGRADGKLATTNSIFDENKRMFQSEINDIQDTLTSDNSNKPLSAKQGKILKELLDSKVIEAGSVPIDTTPIEGNITHLVNSDGLAKEFNKHNTEIILGGIYDVSSHNNGIVFESLSALLSSPNLSTLIPTSVRHGGMMIRFIQDSEQSSNNKYVQYRLMSPTWSTIVANWQGVDDKPTAGSNNLVKSGSVQNELTYLGQKIGLIAFELGSIDTLGHEQPVTNRIRNVNYIKVGLNSDCKIEFNGFGKLAVHCFDANFNHLLDSGWITESYVIPNNTVYIRIALALTNNADLTDNDIVLLKKSICIRFADTQRLICIENDISKISKSVSSIDSEITFNTKAINSDFTETGKKINRGEYILTINSVSITSKIQAAYIGVDYNVYNVKVGDYFGVYVGSRTDGGHNSFYRIRFYNNDTIVSEHYLSTLKLLQIPIGTTRILVTLNATCGITINADTTVTLNDIIFIYRTKEIYETTVTDNSQNIPGLISAEIVSKTNEMLSLTGSNIYKASQLVSKTSSTTPYQGIRWLITSFPSNKKIGLFANRTGGQDTVGDITFLDANGGIISAFWNINQYYSIPTNTATIRCTLHLCWGTELVADTQVVFDEVEIKYQDTDLSSTILGVGDEIYEGSSPISFVKKRYNYSSSPWKVFAYDEQMNFEYGQSMVIYNNKVFIFLNGGAVHVYDYLNKNYITTFNVESTNNHSNAAVWSNMFYDSGDTYPLLLLSKCYGDGGCLVYRIVESKGTFVATKIKEIVYENNMYDGSWAIDNNKLTLYYISYTIGNYDVSEVKGNQIKIVGFNLPNIIDSNDVVLGNSDIISQQILPFAVVQDCEIYDGFLYLGVVGGTSPQPYGNIFGVRKIDLEKGIICCHLPSKWQELEGVTVYNNKLYTMNREYTSTTEPLKIYEYSFN